MRIDILTLKEKPIHLCLNIISAKNMIMAKKIPFENELILHLLTQKHLKELFDLECVASEIQLHKLRLDNLAFDEKNNSFVIIEYKNRFNANVLKQAQDYHDLLLNNKDFFLKRLKSPKNVCFEKTRVMIIGPKFSDEQIEKAKSKFELWHVSLNDDCCVEYKNLHTGKTKKLKVSKDELKLTEVDLLKNKTNEICSLYHALRNRVKNEFSDVECKILVDEISFKTNNMIICNVRFLKKSFNAYFYAEKLFDRENRLRDISDISTAGKANFEFKISSENDLDYFIELFKQTYKQKVSK